LGLDASLDVLLVLTGALQVGALATRIMGRGRAALVLAAMNTAVALALVLVVAAEFLANHERVELVPAVLFALQVTAAVAAVIGVVKRREPGWLFWPVWLWSFGMIYALVRLRFFFRVYF